ncbi:MAG: hypothetical protein K2H64_03130 [Desulfovibrio sp.]|nr:hypothetical protein [Desulfovibrio sp.]
MDYGLINALGMTVMAAFGLWALRYGLLKHARKDKNKDEPERRSLKDKD